MESLLAMGARIWQSEIAAPILEKALLETIPLEIPAVNEAETTDEQNI
jgi:ribonuclease D